MLFKAFTALSVAVAALAQNSFSINTPAAIVQCQPAAVTWVGGTGPYILAVIPGGETGAAAISTLSTSLSSSPYTWTVDLASGTYITLKLTDSQGNIAYSSPLTIQAGASNACLNAGASTAGIATTGAVTTTGSGSQTLSATSAAASSASSASQASSASAASSASSASAASSAPATSASSAAAASSAASRPVSSAVGAATSAAASAAPSSGAMSGAFVNVPVVAAGVFGGLAILL